MRGSVCGTVSEDTNNNDASENGLEGVQVELFEVVDSRTNVVDSVSMSVGGSYCFEELLPGTYTVQQTNLENGEFYLAVGRFYWLIVVVDCCTTTTASPK